MGEDTTGVESPSIALKFGRGSWPLTIGNWKAEVVAANRGLSFAIGLKELQKCNGIGVLGSPIIGLAIMNGVCSAEKCANGLGLSNGTGVAAVIVVCTGAFTFSINGLGFGLEDDLLQLGLLKAHCVELTTELDDTNTTDGIVADDVINCACPFCDLAGIFMSLISSFKLISEY